MDLLTVTCNRDFKYMFLQAKSIENFLPHGSRHWLLINEPQKNLFKYDWEKTFSFYYKNHELKIKYCDPKYWNLVQDGWTIQQIWKLVASKFIKNDYLILDSKNFFVKSVNLIDWTHDGSGILISKSINRDVFNLWESTNKLYSKNLNLPLLDTYYAPETPYIIRDKIIRKAVLQENFEQWFINCTKKINASEFLYYAYFLRNEKHVFSWKRRHHTIWPQLKNLKNWFKEDDFFLMEISGIHRGWFEKAELSQKQLIKDWLNTLNLLDDNSIKLFD